MPNAIEAMRLFDSLAEGLGNYEYCSILVDKFSHLITEVEAEIDGKKVKTFDELIQKPDVVVIGALSKVAMEIHDFIFTDDNKKKDAPN